MVSRRQVNHKGFEDAKQIAASVLLGKAASQLPF